MFFFQVELLAGYLYAHLLIRYMGGLASFLVHLAALIFAVASLPIVVNVPVKGSSPIESLISLLFTSVGIPFFLLSATSPLLQSWYGRRFCREPYYLYAASNIGSAGAVLFYPFILEPTVGLTLQTTLWQYGFYVLVALVLLCNLSVVRHVLEQPARERGALPTARLVRWLLLALCPSSLTLGVTTHISSELAPVPLLWMIPLLLYLVTFIIGFSHLKYCAWAERPFLLLTIILLITWSLGLSEPLVFLVSLHLVVFFLAALLCHSRLAQSRPPAKDLTLFYLTIAFGGVIGACVNSVIAPALFNSYLEYPLMLVAVGAVVITVQLSTLRSLIRELLYLSIMCGVGGVLISNASRLDDDPLRVIVTTLGGLGLLSLFNSTHGVRYVTSCLSILIAGSFNEGVFGAKVAATRNFFGTLSVTTSPDQRFRYLVHGATIHGIERLDAVGECIPLSYYHRTGPAGDLLGARKKEAHSVALIGLGTGSLLCYGREGDRFHIYEINPSVKALAEKYFTFLSSRPEVAVDYIIGDGRLELKRAPSTYNVIVIDAFSSDAIPIHLLTEQAFQIYREKLTENGHILLHISNRFLNLVPIVARVAKASGLGSYKAEEPGLSEKEVKEGKYSSDWMVVTKGDARELESGGTRWEKVEADEATPWSDDYANLLEALK